MDKIHQVAKGDCISSIALKYGFFEDTLWNYSDNAELKSLRKNKNALLPGDEVAIPGLRQKHEPAATNQKTRFVRKGVPAIFKVSFEFNGEPRANQTVKVEVDAKDIGEFSTDGNGLLEVPISPSAKKVVVRFDAGRPNPEKYQFDLGVIDPIDTVTGQKARLTNLGFYFGAIDKTIDEEFAQDLRAFQAAHDLEESGVVDDATQGKLEEVYGS
ncbi:MAG: hypothetical protein ACJAS1_000439 [Oleiphilaceae bacterium]|jgi:hypothetical protein